MLFLLFQLGEDRYALEASRVIEVLPLVELRPLPAAPPGVAGLFNYRGRPLPAVDLCQLTLQRPARERLSTRIIVVPGGGPPDAPHLLGLICEQATGLLRRDTRDFVSPGLALEAAPYLGPVATDAQGMIQWLHPDRLLPETVRETLFPHVQHPAHASH